VKAQATDDEDSVGVAGNAAIVGGLISNAVVAWSLVTLKNTGCGLPPGPGGTHPTPTLTPTLHLALPLPKPLALPNSHPHPNAGGLVGLTEGLSYLAVLGMCALA